MNWMIFTLLLMTALHAGVDAQTVQARKFPGMGLGAVLDYRNTNGRSGAVILIAPTDMKLPYNWYDAVGQPAAGGSFVQSSCASTYLAAREPASEQGQWRIPTRTELSIMWQMRTEIEKIYGQKNGFHGSDYWSSEEYDVTKGWFVTFMNGRAYYIEKQSKSRVRCVKTLVK